MGQDSRSHDAKPQPYLKPTTWLPQWLPKLGSVDQSGIGYWPDLQELGGAEGIRTPDPLHAMEVRYQLRYSPVNRIWSRGIGRPEQHTGCIYLLAPTSAHPAGCTPPGQANIASAAAPAATVPRLSPVLVKGTEIIEQLFGRL